ncbi:DUF423 domain-containing protein [Chitinibacteraceae bacterium HSL-7]
MNRFAFFGAINLFAVVALGAFGAHGLKARLTPEALGWWHTAVQYHAWHALGLLALAALPVSRPALATWSGWLLLAGIVVFCGSLYAMALGAPRWFGAITPLGGSAWLVAWLLLALALRPQ